LRFPTLRDFLRAVHAEDDAIGAPVGSKIHPASQEQSKQDTLLAAQGLPDPKKQRGERCEQYRGFHAVHGTLPQKKNPSRR
jgi:hypothetical protein